MDFRIVTLAALVALASAHAPHKICVPRGAMDACKKMVEQGKGIGVLMECYAARDRLECVEQVRDHKADFEAVEPEDMYLAATMEDPKFRVFKEIRTKEEPQAEFRYEAVAVVHKDLEINDLHQLRGLSSCHTGVGRNVGYKIPITKLSAMGLLPSINDMSLSPRENELKALSSFFSKACLVGKWSPHPETDQKLKSKYGNLCQLCEHPDKCDYPDANSGYEGALNCLVSGGQIAWTKVIFVNKFFGMAYGSQPAKPADHSPEDFRYLCPDATKRPITGPPCSWAARPWPGYMANSDISNDVKELREEIKKLNDLGESNHAEWLAQVLLLNNKTVAVDNKEVVQPMNYLEKAKYLDVIERGKGSERKVVVCAVGKDAEDKCDALKRAAYSRDVRPQLDCHQEATDRDCMDAVSQRKAHVVVLDPHQALTAQRTYKLKPLLMERYESSESQQLLLVVKKSSKYQKVEDIKGSKACVQPFGTAGQTGAVKYLLDNEQIPKNNCPHEKSFKAYFSSVTETEDPIDCLIHKDGDVAFVPYSSLHSSRGEELEVICSEGRKPFSDANTCFITTIPPKLVMSSEDLTKVEEDDVRFSLLAAGDMFSKKPELFKMFGHYGPNETKPNLLFSDHATGLKAVADVVPSYEEYKKTVAELNICGN